MSQPSRLHWRCRRGIKEMDLLLEQFLERYYHSLPPDQQQNFESLLEEADLDIYDWILGRSKPDNPVYLHLINQLQSLNKA